MHQQTNTNTTYENAAEDKLIGSPEKTKKILLPGNGEESVGLTGFTVEIIVIAKEAFQQSESYKPADQLHPHIIPPLLCR